MVYRRDIDSLRAVAVLSVVFYHLNYRNFQGGFIGVDVFFVISGFLITYIMNKQIQDNKFSFLTFYCKRILRLMPALFFLLSCTAVISYYTLKPNLLMLFGNSLKYSGLLLTNMFFLQNSHDYFAKGIYESNPLLHLWSLAIEEQFYLIFPILIYCLFKYFNKRKATIILSLISIISFLNCLYLMKSDQNAAFYSLENRAWELLIGSILALKIDDLPRVNSSIANIIHWFCIGCLLHLGVNYSHQTNFPGFAALPPVFLSALLIYSGKFLKGKTKQVFESKVLVYIGLISYSLYIWHWPIIVFAKSEIVRIFYDIEINRTFQLIISITLSLVSYYFIEKPFRKIKVKNQARVILSGLTILCILFLSGDVLSRANLEGSLVRQNFIDDDYFEQIPLKEDVPHRKWQMISPNDQVIVGDKTVEPSIIIIGDSYTSMWGDGLNGFLEKNRVSAILLAKGYCIFLKNLTNKELAECEHFNRQRFNFLQKTSINKIVLISSWRILFQGKIYKNKGEELKGEANIKQFFVETFESLPEKDFYIVKSIVPLPIKASEIYFKNLKNPLSERYGFLLEDFRNMEKWYNMQEDIFRDLGHIKNVKKIMNPNNLLCPEGRCLTIKKHKLLIHDIDHLNKFGSNFLVSIFDVVL